MTKEQIISAAVECFGLGPEDQDAVLRFGMKLQDMEAQPMTVEQIMEVHEAHGHWVESLLYTPTEKEVRDNLHTRIATLLNTSAAMADLERCQKRVKDMGVDLGELDRITDQGRED